MEGARRGTGKGYKKLVIGAICTIALIYGVAVFVMGSTEVVDPLVGPRDWAHGFLRETALGTYRVWESADFHGGDTAFLEVKSLDECLFACDESPSCMYVTMLHNECFLKESPSGFEAYDKRPHLASAKRISVKPLVSDKWHSAAVHDTPTSTYRVWAGHIFDGSAVQSVRTLDLSACLTTCDKLPECMYVNFDGSHCNVLKDTFRHLKIRTDLVGAASAMRVRRTDMPDSLVKHHWAKGGARETADSFYQTWAGCHFEGDDIAAVRADDLSHCLDLCDKELFCHHVTLIDHECMLKGQGVVSFDVLGRPDSWAAKQVAKKKKPSRAIRKTANGTQEIGDLREDSLVGMYYDEGTSQDTKMSRYQVWAGFDLWGGDVSKKSAVLTAYTLEECLNKCDEVRECNYAVAIVGKECWLKEYPFQFARVSDRRDDLFAAMKLGRVGKQGLDVQTTFKHNSRPPRLFRPPLPIHKLHHGAVSHMSRPVFWVVVVAVMLFVVLYTNHISTRYYVNELM
eukprot:c4718_g1_i1.p1 GENE.c4718_g1_i1~~c4718_g1_i1.p1  ORF type:complete len:512 (+),score=137.02 c4718_g1_i1:44-1579(+)